MKNYISSIPNWHRYVLGALAALAAVCTAVIAGTVTVPPEAVHLAPYAGLVLVFLTAFLPRVQTETGPGAPPLVSPPVHDDAPISDGQPPARPPIAGGAEQPRPLVNVSGLGAIIAIIVLVIVVVLGFIHQGQIELLVLIGGLAIARLT